MPASEVSGVRFRRAPATLHRTVIERFASRLRREVTGGRPFDVLITGDAELRGLNREYLGKDYATDVLSFPAEGPDPHLGDVAISLGRARAQAKQFGHAIEREVEILMLHGVLHLMGFDHETDRGGMARAEKRWRARLSLPVGLIERIRQ
jgi:probable rRNA maturation factor